MTSPINVIGNKGTGGMAEQFHVALNTSLRLDNGNLKRLIDLLQMEYLHRMSSTKRQAFSSSIAKQLDGSSKKKPGKKAKKAIPPLVSKWQEFKEFQDHKKATNELKILAKKHNKAFSELISNPPADGVVAVSTFLDCRNAWEQKRVALIKEDPARFRPAKKRDIKRGVGQTVQIVPPSSNSSTSNLAPGIIHPIGAVSEGPYNPFLTGTNVSGVNLYGEDPNRVLNLHGMVTRSKSNDRGPSNPNR